MPKVSEEKMKKIVLSGLIGSGKSYIMNELKKRGVTTLDLDVVAKEVRNTSAKQSIIDAFGTTILSDNQIDPKKLSEIVFNDVNKRKKLEALIHPRVLDEMLHFFAEHQQDQFVVVEMALVFEFGWEKYFDEVWVVDCKREVAFERLIKYRGYSENKADRILKSQFDNQGKLEKADKVIVNNGNQEELDLQLDSLLKGVANVKG